MNDQIIKEQITIIEHLVNQILAISNTQKMEITIQLMVLAAACFYTGQLIREVFTMMITRYKQTK